MACGVGARAIGVLGMVGAFWVGCTPTPGKTAGDVGRLRKEAESMLTSGAACSAIRPSTKPDLFGWDPGTRGEVATIARQGLVVVKYERRNCDVMLTVLSDCTSSKATYRYMAYTETQTRTAETEQGLYASFPLAALSLRARMAEGKGIRADYRLVGIESIPIGTVVERGDLQGACNGATHVVRAIHRGVFAMGVGAKREISADGTLLGGDLRERIQIFDQAGVPARCRDDAAALQEGCDIPLRLELSPVGGAGGEAPTAAPTAEPEKDSAQLLAGEIDAVHGEMRSTEKKTQELRGTFQRLKTLCASPDLTDESKIGLLDKLISTVGEDSEIGRDAVRLREDLVLGPRITRSLWLSASFTGPEPGGGIEVGRLRRQFSQVSLARAFVVTTEGLGAGAGILGIGLKWNNGSGAVEAGFLVYPLSFALYKATQSYQSCTLNSTLHSYECEEKTANPKHLLFLLTTPYVAWNLPSFQISAGAILSPIWWGGKREDNATEDKNGLFRFSRFPAFFFIGVGF